MRIVMFGNGPFAAPTLAALLAADVRVRHRVVAVVVRPSHQRRQCYAEDSPVRVLATAQGLPVLDPESVNTPEFQATLAAFRPDLLVVCDFGQILKRATLAIASSGGVNLHGSLLPKYRGAAPINWAIYHGETETGVSVIHMTPRMDAGPCLAQAAMPIGPDETAVELEPRLAQLGAPLVVQTIDALAAGTVRPISQDESLATAAPRLKKEDGAIDWSRSAAAIRHQIRALQPWPRSYTHWRHGEDEPLRLLIDQVQVVEKWCATKETPGLVLRADHDVLTVAAGDETHALTLTHVQPAGKRRMTAAEFLRGHTVAVGDVLR